VRRSDDDFGVTVAAAPPRSCAESQHDFIPSQTLHRSVLRVVHGFGFAVPEDADDDADDDADVAAVAGKPAAVAAEGAAAVAVGVTMGMDWKSLTIASTYCLRRAASSSSSTTANARLCASCRTKYGYIPSF